MATMVDESDLQTDESDLETPAQTAAARRTAIAQSEIPPTQRPPIWNPQSRAATRFVAGVALPSIAAAPFTGGASILAGMGGAAAAEGIDYATSPPEERPSLAGAATRVAAQGAIPAVLGRVGKTLAPLAEKIPTLIPKAAMESEAASIARNVVHKAQLFKATTTEEKDLIDGIVQETTHYSPLIDAKDILQKLDEVKPMFRIKEAYEEIVDAVKVAAKDGNGNVALPELHAILRRARQMATTKADWKAIGLAKSELLDAMEEHISANHPLGAKAGTLFRKLNNEIGTKLGVVEDAMDLFKNDPMKAITNIARSEDARYMIKALDHVAGTNFAPQIDALSQKVITEGAKVGQAATIKAAQAEARQTLKGVLTAAAIGTGGVSNILLSLIVGRIPGQLPLERTVGRVAVGAAKAALPATAVVGKGIESLFGTPPQATPATETDLEEQR